MRPFPQSGSKCFLVRRLTLYSLLAGVAICNSGCANVASIPSPPSGPQAISVTVMPSSGSVMLGNQFLFTAAVKNSSDNTVTWSVNGVAGGGAQTGTITSGGVYTAPGDLPIPANLTVAATSHADVSKSGSAIVTVQSDVSISLPSGGGTGAVPVELGATHAFLAVVSSGAHPDRSVLWSVSGPSCPLLSDTLRVGAIRGHILNANPLSLPASPPGVTGVFGSHVVAVDAASGAVVGATVGGWSCSDPGPAQFDGSYAIERLPTGSSYLIYAEPLNGAVDPSEISNATASLCRNSTSDPGWPPLQGCVAPPVDVSFTVRTRPGP
jgi:hypothetical protein